MKLHIDEIESIQATYRNGLLVELEIDLTNGETLIKGHYPEIDFSEIPKAAAAYIVQKIGFSFDRKIDNDYTTFKF